MSEPPELVVLSHLRWSWVWQRPQQLVSRLARAWPTSFVEEPQFADVAAPALVTEHRAPVTRLWLQLPRVPGRLEPETLGGKGHLGFGDPLAASYARLLAQRLERTHPRVVWLYTPLALPIAHALVPDVLVYDCMDDLAAFRNAPPGVRALQRRLLAEADLVFTGGRSLHAGIRASAPDRTFLFPSGVDPEHFARARSLRTARSRPVAGYVGVIDDRLDLELVAALARRLPEWEVRMVGPLAKIGASDLPREANLTYLGQQPYEELPAVMAEFDVALMPFARNEATRAISPTKTPEYLAAGLPVVSTRVPDVVATYAGVVAFADDAEGFAAACERVRRDDPAQRDAKARPLLSLQRWDSIASRMARLVEAELSRPRAQGGGATARDVRTAPARAGSSGAA